MDSISLRFCFPSYRVCFPISRCYIKYSTFLPIDNYSCRCPKSLFELLLKAKFHHLVLCSTHVLFIFSTTCHPTPPPHSVGYTRPTYHFGDTDFLQFMKTQNVIILCAPSSILKRQSMLLSFLEKYVHHYHFHSFSKVYHHLFFSILVMATQLFHHFLVTNDFLTQMSEMPQISSPMPLWNLSFSFSSHTFLPCLFNSP